VRVVLPLQALLMGQAPLRQVLAQVLMGQVLQPPY
jgi:hypothetical protein